MLSEFETKQIGDWLNDIENVRSLSSEEQMELAQANKEICDAQLQLPVLPLVWTEIEGRDRMKALIIALMKFLVVCWIWQRLEIKFYESIQVREVDNYIAFILFYYILKGEQG